MQKHVNLVDLVKSSNEFLFNKIDVDTAENEPLEGHLIIKPWDLIFTEPPRPSSTEGAALIDWGTGGAGASFFLL